ncbi:MAG: DUF1641 domain-containing protein [Bacteroidales bacterium]|jgi:uncharacterized protein YjgD (DUF1641 family)|nr:DUF1641 domain-containing protein [Bacteroidales bacterium]
MANDNIQEQINEINRKLDLVLEEVMAQKETRQSIEDLTTDLTIVGKDVFKSTVTELDNAGVEIDGEAVKQLMLKLVRNVDTLNEMFEMLESANDLIKDVTPILHQMGLDGIHLMNEFEQKGYFEFMKESMKIFDNIFTHFSSEDVKLLADNVVTILETVKNLTQPDMLKAINSGLVVYKSIEIDNVEEYSIWRAMKAMNSKEMKKGIGFMITFLQNIAKETEKAKNNS